MGVEFNTHLYDWIDLSLSIDYPGLIIIEAEQNGPRPKLPYVTYKALIWNEDAYSTWKRAEVDDDTFGVTYETRARIQVSVNAYATDGREMLTLLKDREWSWQVRRLLMNNRMSLINTGEIQNIPYLGDTNYLKRFFRTFNFLASTEFTDIRSRVHEVNISGTIKQDEV